MGLFFRLNRLYIERIEPLYWILRNAIWNDSYIWIDEEVWID